VVKNLPANAEDAGDVSLIPGSERYYDLRKLKWKNFLGLTKSPVYEKPFLQSKEN